MDCEEKESLVCQVYQHLEPKIINLPEDIGSQSSNHNNSHEKSVEHIKAGNGPRSIPLTPVKQVGVGMVQSEA